MVLTDYLILYRELFSQGLEHNSSWGYYFYSETTEEGAEQDWTERHGGSHQDRKEEFSA